MPIQKQEMVDLSEYRIFETDEFAKSFGKLQKNDSVLIRKKLSGFVYPQLKQMPYYGSNIKKLHAFHPETWRYRIGDYRIFFSIEEKERIVFVLTIEKRKDAYK